MSWGCNTKQKCEKCGYECIVEESTLIINSKSYGVCPKCGEKMTVEEIEAIADVVAEKIATIRKRKEAKMRNRI